MDERLSVALIYGGRGLEREVSVSGAKNLCRYLCDFKIVPIFINERGSWLGTDEDFDAKGTLPGKDAFREILTPINLDGYGALINPGGKITRIDAAVALLHGDYGEDGSVQGALENANIPFFGCKSTESSLCYDKIYTKILAEGLGIPTSKSYFAIDKTEKEAREGAENAFSYPMFVKPARLGSSFGASPVRRREDFEESYEKAKKLGGGRVLIEELVDIRAELECVYFNYGSKELFTKIGEISYGSDFYDYDTKYNSSNKASVIADSPFDKTYGEKIRDYSEKLRRIIGIRDLSRFDFFLDYSGRLLFNEINTIPGFTKTSLCPRLIEQSGVELRGALFEAVRLRALGG